MRAVASGTTGRMLARQGLKFDQGVKYFMIIEPESPVMIGEA